MRAIAAFALDLGGSVERLPGGVGAWIVGDVVTILSAPLGEAIGKGAVPQLERLYLDGNALGARGAAALAAIRAEAVPKLKGIYVTRRLQSAEDQATLRKARGVRIWLE